MMKYYPSKTFLIFNAILEVPNKMLMFFIDQSNNVNMI